MGRRGNRTYGIERPGTKLYALAQRGLARRCTNCGSDFIIAEVFPTLTPLTIEPQQCSQFCYDIERGMYDESPQMGGNE